jgi:carbamate kinase
MSKTVVVAVGGNALTGESEIGTYEVQSANARGMAKAVGQLTAAGWTVVLVHGNGPQVGNLLIQQEAGTATGDGTGVPAQPLFNLDAMTQGQIGSMLALALHAELGPEHPPIASVVTHVVVDAADPAFEHPTKPVGPFFTAGDAERLGAERGWTLREDAGRGWRRIVASPVPREIVELDVVRRMAEAGVLVIAAGGGGVPVLGQDGTDGGYVGVDAVIDKDRSAALLAAAMGADALVLITGVETVMLDFGTPRARVVHEMTVTEAATHLADGQFPPGSMGPKVEAAISFLRGGGHTAVITTAELAAHALAGGSAQEPAPGTRIVAA